MKRASATFLYLRTWFLLDVIASFPYDYLIDDTSSDGSAA